MCASRMAEAIQPKPRALLRDLDVLGQLSAGDAVLLRRDQPDGHEPFAKREFGILENRADPHRKLAAA
jgi:hypothetical protein